LKHYLLIILILAVKVSIAQFENTDIGARAVALCGAFTSMSDNSLAIFYNPSGLGQNKFRELSVFYSPAPYGLKELSTAALTYCEPFRFGTFGAGIKTYGYELYREFNFILSYGNVYKKRIFYGLNLNYYNLNIKDYNSASSFGLDIGAMIYITDFMRWGVFAKNVSGSTIGLSKEKIAQVYRTGFSVQPRGDLFFILEAEKDVMNPVSVRGAMEYSILDFLDLRAGVSTNPSTFSGGIGFCYEIFQLDYALYNSFDLGLTHQGSLTINFGGKGARKSARELLKNAFKSINN